MATKTTTKQAPSANLTNTVLIAIVVSTIALIVMVIVGRIFVGQIILKNKIISAKSAAEKQLVSNIDAINSLSKQYDGLGDKKKIIADALPTKPDFPALSSLMENIAKSSGIHLQSVSTATVATGQSTAPVSAPAVSGAQPFVFTIAVQGSYTSIKTLLTNIETSAQPMRVSNITVGGSSDILTVQLVITTYYQSTSGLTAKTKVIE